MIIKHLHFQIQTYNNWLIVFTPLRIINDSNKFKTELYQITLIIVDSRGN